MAAAAPDASRAEPAFAKVNLSLRVLERRSDGYHDVDTVLQAVGLCDDVEVALWTDVPRSVELRCDRPDLENRDNLAWRAAALLLERLGLRARVRIALRKAIPSGAGLGGGSSDAGAVLRALGRLLPERPPAGLLHAAASELGSDVPYFLVGGTAAASGRGTEVAPLPDLPPVPVVLLLPDLEVPTPWAYRELAARRRAGLTGPAGAGTIGASGRIAPPTGTEALASPAEWMCNDFESTVLDRYPVLQAHKRLLLACGARHAMLSGSGSALFGLFDSAGAAREAADRGMAEGLRAEVTEFLPREAAGRLTGAGA